ELALWAKEVLKAIESLRSMVEEYEREFERLLCQRQASLDLVSIHPQVHARLLAEVEQQTTLTNPQLYWYLCGVLAMLCQQPEMQLDESQKQAVLAQLRRFTNTHEEAEKRASSLI